MKRLLCLAFWCFCFASVFGQEVRPIITYPLIKGFTSFSYHSDSIIMVNGTEQPFFLNSQKTLEAVSKDGQVYTSPNGKQYHITANGRYFSVINPISHKLENSVLNDIYTDKVVEYFEVVNDKYFVLKFVDDTLFFKIDFYGKTPLVQTLMLRLGKTEAKAKCYRLNDSIFYIDSRTSFYKKNIRSGAFTIVNNFISSSLLTYSFYCKDDVIVLATEGSILFSLNGGLNFTTAYSNFNKAIDPQSILIHKNEIWFNEGINNKKTTLTLNKVDFKGKKTKLVDHGSLLPGLSTNYKNKSCDHLDTLSDYIWIDTAHCIVKSKDGDFYRVNVWNKTIKYLGGNYNLGINYLKVNPTGNLMFHETAGKLWGFSSDTGKHWTIPEMVQPKSSVKKVEFNNKTVFVLRDGKLSFYSFIKNAVDTSLYSIALVINDFFISDENTLILIANKQVYQFDIKTSKLSPLTLPTPFDNIGYLKNSKRLLALTNVGIFHSNDMGKTWPASSISGYENFQSLKLNMGFQIKEASNNEVYLNVLFNEKPAMLISKDGGNSFTVERDSLLNKSRSVALFNDKVYMVDSINQLLKLGKDSTGFQIQSYWGYCGVTGLQAISSGLIIWNNRTEFFRLPLINNKTHTESIVCFPNPLNASKSLSLKLPENISEKLSGIELYNILGQKRQNLDYEYLPDENIYSIKNISEGAAQIYYLRIKTNDSKVYLKKILVL